MISSEIKKALESAIEEQDILVLVRDVLGRALDGDNTACKIYFQFLRDLMLSEEKLEINNEAEEIKNKIKQAIELKKRQLKLFDGQLQ